MLVWLHEQLSLMVCADGRIVICNDSNSYVLSLGHMQSERPPQPVMNYEYKCMYNVHV